MVVHLLTNKIEIYIFVAIFGFLTSCKESQNSIEELEYYVPINQFTTNVTDSLDFALVEMKKSDFKAYFQEEIFDDSDSYSTVKNLFTQKSINFSNCNQIIQYPTFVDRNNSLIKNYLDSTSNYLNYKMQNLIVLKSNCKIGEKKAIYIAWINRPIQMNQNGFGQSEILTSDCIDSTTFVVYTTLDIDVFQNLYKKYTGEVEKIEIDTIYLPLLLRSTMYYYAEIRFDNFNNGKPLSTSKTDRGIFMIPEEIRDSVLEVRMKNESLPL
jgi:hypothetical protein